MHDSLFLDSDSGGMRIAINEAEFARELSLLHVACIMDDFREENASADTEEKRSVARARAQRRMAKWRLSKRRVCRMTVLGTNGNLVGGGAGSAEALRSHWSPAFSDASGISVDVAERFLRHAHSFAGEAHRLFRRLFLGCPTC